MDEFCRDLVTAKEDGRIKLYVHYKTLGLRRERPGLLSAGDYFPVACEGTHADHVFAFARRSGNTSVVVAVPRLLASLLTGSEQCPLGQAVWQDTRLVLPAEISGQDWRNVFTGESILCGGAGRPANRRRGAGLRSFSRRLTCERVSI